MKTKLKKNIYVDDTLLLCRSNFDFLLIAKSYLKTNYDLLISDVDHNDYKAIVDF